MSQTDEDIDMNKIDGKAQNCKAEKKSPIPQRTHWILRKMIRQRHVELCGTEPEVALAQPST
jgi:hypothetical protein